MTKLEVLQATRNCAGTNIKVEKDCNVKIREIQRQLIQKVKDVREGTATYLCEAKLVVSRNV
jgi:ribosomal protein L7/L12